uniref:uncharacterized protein n=1 Tax=Pristiophorus japonicus TaxID=55135 RepID=UPI00398E5EA0
MPRYRACLLHARDAETEWRGDPQRGNPQREASRRSPSHRGQHKVHQIPGLPFHTILFKRSCSKIILCQIYHRNHPSKRILGYVVQDDQSNACFGDPEIFDALDLPGPAFPSELATCGEGRLTAEGRRASGLIVQVADGKSEQLPTILGDRNEIPRPDFCEKFPHPRSVAKNIPLLKEDVSIILLIGRSPEPLKIRESRNGPRGTLWAQHIDLAWPVSGHVCPSGANEKAHAFVNYTILQPQPDNPKAMSIQNQHFIKIVTKGAHPNSEGNLEFPLALNNDQTAPPNNKPQALIPIMLLNLKTQLLQAPASNFMQPDLYRRRNRRYAQCLADQFWTDDGRVYKANVMVCSNGMRRSYTRLTSYSYR